MTPAGIAQVAAERLELSRSPAAEVAAAALEAKTKAGLDGPGADYIVIAVERGTVTDVAERIRGAL